MPFAGAGDLQKMMLDSFGMEYVYTNTIHRNR